MQQITETLPDDKVNQLFCTTLVNNINKDHPFAATILKRVNGSILVSVTDAYYKQCEIYVQNHCAIKPSKHAKKEV